MSSSRVPHIPEIIPGNWETVRRFSRDVGKYLRTLANSDQTVYLADFYLTSSTASRLLATDASQKLVSTDLNSWVTGTANEINITDDGDGTITIGIVDPLIVAKGGTGAATLTDHSILLGSGTDAVTALGSATDGQLPIGSTGSDPVLATLTGTANQISVTNGAGSITLALTGNMDEIAALTPTDGNFIVGNGTTWIVESGSTARDSLGLGTSDTPQFAGIGLGTALTAGYVLEVSHTVTGTQGALETYTTSGNATKFGNRYSMSGTVTGAYYVSTNRSDCSVVTDSGPFFYDNSYGLRTLGTKGYYGVVSSASVVNSGFTSLAAGGTYNIAYCGTAGQDLANATNIGIMAAARNNHATNPIHIGGYITLRDTATTPTFTSAALIVDNGDSTSPIFLAQDNNTTVFSIADGGTISGKAANFGDGGSTNYMSIAADGEIGLVGTARVKREFTLPLTDFNPGATGPTPALHGIYPSYEFTIDDDMHTSFEIPPDWDSTTDITVSIYWAINEAYATNSGEVQWKADWAACPADSTEDITSPTHTGTIDFGDVNIPATANYLTITSGTIAAASLSAGDVVALNGSRIDVDDGNDPTAEPYIVNVEIEYTVNKLGEAT